MTMFEIGKPVTSDCHGAAVKVASNGTFSRELNGHVAEGFDPELTLDRFVEIWCGELGIYLVGGKARSVWFVPRDTDRVALALELRRLDFGGRYDPGGMHNVRFVQAGSDYLLLVYEYGLAALDTVGHARWHHVHEDVSMHLDRVEGKYVWFRTEGERVPFDLRTGDRG